MLRTACDVIAERGLANTRTSDVAQAAGVSQALVFYHFSTKERLLSQAFAYAAEKDLARLAVVINGSTAPLDKLKKILKLYAPAGRAKSWAIWIDGWSESLRTPELEKVSRRLDLCWKEAITSVITEGVSTGVFRCDDPSGAAWRIRALVDGLAVQVAVHDRVISRRQFAEWVRGFTAREVDVDPTDLS